MITKLRRNGAIPSSLQGLKNILLHHEAHAKPLPSGVLGNVALLNHKDHNLLVHSTPESEGTLCE